MATAVAGLANMRQQVARRNISAPNSAPTAPERTPCPEIRPPGGSSPTRAYRSRSYWRARRPLPGSLVGGAVFAGGDAQHASKNFSVPVR